MVGAIAAYNHFLAPTTAPPTEIAPAGYEVASATIHPNGSSKVIIPQDGLGFADIKDGVYESTLCAGDPKLCEELVRRALLNSTLA